MPRRAIEGLKSAWSMIQGVPFGETDGRWWSVYFVPFRCLVWRLLEILYCSNIALCDRVTDIFSFRLKI